MAFLHYSLTAEVQSSCLQLIVNGRFGIVPELECRLGSFEPGDIIRLNFQMRRQIVSCDRCAEIDFALSGRVQ